MIKHFLLWLILISGISCQSLATSDDAEQSRPNILLIVSEDNGPDLGCYGVSDVVTPNIDALAKTGLRFKHAFVTYSVCSPSRSTIYTGLYPHQNGQIGLATHKFRMYESFKTLPVYLKEAGYRTGCLGKIHINPESAVPWDFHEIKGSNFAKKDLNGYARHAADFISQGEDPFFLMVNFPDAHCDWQKQVEGMPAHPISGSDLQQSMPFVGVDNPRLRELTANYYNSINRLDESVGMLLDSLRTSGKLENTLIIYLGDHGAQFSRGKCSNYESGLRIPLIVNWPGRVAESQVTEELVSTIDLVPTILSVAGLAVPEHLPGLSLQSLFKQGGRLVKSRNYIYADGAGSAAFYFYPRRSVRDTRFKLIRNLVHERENPKFLAYAFQMYGTGTLPEELPAATPEVQRAYATWQNPPEFEFYDLENDPYEFNDLSEDPHFEAEKERLKKALLDWQKESLDPLNDPNILAKVVNEMDSVNSRYPGRDYGKNPDFKWNYPEYFKEFIDSKQEAF
jgi:N-sulfoglucosamine sulfohydrolase